MKKIILDARKLNDYGIGEYIKTLFPAIATSENFDTRIILNKNSNSISKVFGGLHKDKIIYSKYSNYTIGEHFEIPRKVSSIKDFYYFSPHYLFPYFLKNKLIVTIHDLIHFKFPSYFKPGIKVILAKQFIKKIKNSDSLVFTVSENSKTDLIEMFDFKKENIRVIFNGISDIFFKYKKGANPKPFPYIMYAGNFKPHKNLIILLRAFKQISEKYRDIRLVLAGVNSSKTLYGLINDLNISDKVIPTGYIPVQDLIDLLDFSELFVFPSLYEGFGLPPIEAMARGKAVISTRCGSLGEVLGDASVYFDQHSDQDLSNKIEQLLTDSNLKYEFESKGRTHAKKYTTKSMVESYLSQLRRI